jgi:ABC-type bacteriocin/lantibiotic exporter with double-glycine peptidase domain
VIAAGLAALVVFNSVYAWLQVGWMSEFSAECEKRMSSLLMRRVLFAPYGWLVRQNSGRLRQLLFGFVAVWSRDFIRAFMRLLNDVTMSIFIIAALVWSSPLVGFIVALMGILLGGTAFLFVQPRLKTLAETKREGIIRANSISTECVLGAKDVKMASAEERFLALFDKYVRVYAGADARAQQWAQVPRNAMELATYGSLILASVYVVLTGAQNTKLAGLLLLYGLAAMRLLPVFSTAVGALASLISALPVIRDLEKLLVDTAGAESEFVPNIAEWPWQCVELQNVFLRYEGAGYFAVRDVSVSFQRGRSYAIVGPSGAGKSSLIDVIAGLLEPTDGAVVIDDERLDREKRRAWRQRFGYVAQQPFLLDGSLRENIVFNSEKKFDMARLHEVVRLACLESVVQRLPNGLNGQVGEQGALLSGGERQRVAIARALYRGANLLILDEPTSSLDTLVEAEIKESLLMLRGEVTTLIVSHRLGLVRDCDEIWLMEEGMLKARGVHSVLVERVDLYRRMVASADRIVA